MAWLTNTEGQIIWKHVRL